MNKKVICMVLCVVLLLTQSTIVMATQRKSELQQQKSDAEQELEEAQDTIDSLSEQIAVISSQIDETNGELLDTLVQIDIAEQEIAATEATIAETQVQIEVTTQELAVAEVNRDKQYADMKTRIRYIYENGGDSAWFRIVLQVTDITSMLNRAEYAQSMHDYDRKMLTQFADVVQQVVELKSSLQSQKNQLETEKGYLEEQKIGLQEQETQLQETLARLQATNSDYADQMTRTREQATQISALIAQQQAEIERIEEEERRAEEARREEERRQQQNNSSNNNNSNNTNSNKKIPPYTGDGSGASIVAYADKFVGNPYVWAGNDLLHGIDCSHFVYQILTRCGVYHGGYVTSAGWPSKGRPVSSLDEAQAGDVICYSGHVAIYDGHGGIVEAKGTAWGITHDRSAKCNHIVAIRRFI